MENEEFDEVQDEIDTALKDERGLVAHKKRLGFCLSDGMAQLLEDYLIKMNVLKSGIKIDHRWLKKKRENVKKLISDKIIVNLSALSKLDKILDAAYEIESKRNFLVYTNKATEELLKTLIDKFLEIKKEVEND